MAAASITPQSFLSLPKPKPNRPFFYNPPTNINFLKPNNKRCSLHLVGSGPSEFDVIPVQSDDRMDQQDGVVCMERETKETEADLVVGGFSNEASGSLSFEGAAGFSSSASNVAGSGSGDQKSQLEMERFVDRTINATIVLAGSFAIAKLLTIDHNYWHGWTLFEILRYALQHTGVRMRKLLKHTQS